VLRAEGEWLSYVRAAHELLPGYGATRRSAAALIAGSESARDQFAPYQERCVYIPENAIDPARFERVCTPWESGPLKVAFVGRLVPYKGADMLIEAAAPLVRDGRVVVDVLGDGPQMPALRALVERLGLRDGVKLPGWVPHKQLQGRLAQSNVFGFPSVREFGGAVVLEAMALGLVPVVAGYAGPNEIVTLRTGVRVPIASRTALVAGVRDALEGFLKDPTRLLEMGRRARERALGGFTWRVKAGQVLEVYRWVLGERQKPDFGMPLPDSS
jgi:glycosyltransferase involved in cell wall biosynthesis